MTDAAGTRAPFLVAIAAAMGVTIALLILSATGTQYKHGINRHGITATLEAYDPADGTELWATELDVTYPPVFADDLVLVLAEGEVTALDGTGDVIWRTPVPGSVFLFAAGGRVFVRADGHESGPRFVVLDAADGTELWATELDIDYPPQVADDLVLAVAEGKVTAWDGTGDVVWRTRVPGSRYVVAARGRVYVRAHGHESGPRVVALDAADGTILWEREGTLLHIGADMVALSQDRHVVLVQPESGELIARFEAGGGARFAGNDSALASLEDRVVKVFTADGESFELPGRVPKQTWLLGIEDDAVVLSVLGADGRRTAKGLDRATGEELWRLPGSEYLSETSASLVPFPGIRSWIASSGGPSPSLVTLGAEVRAVDPTTRYFAIGNATYAVDAETDQVLWTRPGEVPVATTTGLAVFKHKSRYAVVAVDSGEVVFTSRRVAASRVRIGGDRVVLDVGPRVLVVAGDRTVTEIFEGKSRLETASREYAVLSNRRERSKKPKAVMVFDLETGDEIFSGNFARVYGTMELDGDKLRFNHEQSATEIDLATGETTSIARYDYAQPPRDLDPTPIALAFDSDLTRLLWTADAGSVAAVGNSIVISTHHQHP